MNQEDFKKRYKFDPSKDRLGEGGFGEVFKAYDTYLDRWVALKVSKVKADFQELRLRNEVDILNKLPAHPNVARYEECYTFTTISGEHDFAILQYYESGNLLDIIKKQELSVSQKYQILSGLLEGVKFIHDHGIIHRDIKPQNILIVHRDNQYIPKITDFGISKKLNSPKAAQYSNSLVGAGTITYSSPEQLADKVIRKNSDLWSLGVIAFQLLYGELPFNSGEHSTSSELGRQEIMKQINSGKLPETVSQIPMPWRKIIENCLIKDPTQRIQSVDECILILKGSLPEATNSRSRRNNYIEEDVTQIATTNTVKAKRKISNKLLIVVSACCLLVASLFILYKRNSASPETIRNIEPIELAKDSSLISKTEEHPQPALLAENKENKVEKPVELVTKKKEPDSAAPADGKIVFPNGNTYTGQLLNGKMNGKGKYWFKAGGLISGDDPMERKAEAEDYIIGNWVNGDLYMGNLFDKNGTQKDRIIIGRN